MVNFVFNWMKSLLSKQKRMKSVGNIYTFLEKVEANRYENSQQVFDDLTDIWEETIKTQEKKKTVILKSNQFKTQNYFQKDVEVMATQIRRKIFQMQETRTG